MINFFHYFEQERKAKGIIDALPEFNFDVFIKKFRTKNAQNDNSFYYYDQYVNKLESENRIKTAITYKNSLASLKKYTGKDTLTFSKITPEFLQAYENWMKKKGKSVTTVGFYLRSLRTIYNEAIQEGIIKEEYYPFGKRKYIIPAPRNIKKALSIDEIRQIYNYSAPENSSEERYLAYWIFSFLCNGLNMKDIARLKFNNIRGENIEVIRAKTEQTSKKHLKPITAYILPRMREIIEKFGNEHVKGNENNYIFPILKPKLSATDEAKCIDNTIRLVNKYIARVAEKLEIEKEITTYTARHTYATLMRNMGASNEFIAEMVGHSDPKTTTAYLDSFHKDVKKDWAERLTNVLQPVTLPAEK